MAGRLFKAPRTFPISCQSPSNGTLKFTVQHSIFDFYGQHSTKGPDCN